MSDCEINVILLISLRNLYEITKISIITNLNTEEGKARPTYMERQVGMKLRLITKLLNKKKDTKDLKNVKIILSICVRSPKTR